MTQTCSNFLRRWFITISITALVNLATFAGYAESPIRFDAPAVVPANELEATSNAQKIIEVIVPVSLSTRPGSLRVNEIRIDICWNRVSYPVVDYGPRTAMQTHIDGNITVERKSDSNGSLGLNLNGGTSSIFKGSADVDLSNRSQQTTRYQEIPQHDVLASSGTIERGTGVRFSFRPSRTTTLEGGRDLIVAFAVPADWRGGVLMVKCHANGNRPMFGGFSDDFDQGVAFVVPVYLKSDDQARNFANDFVSQENELRTNWRYHLQRTTGSKNLLQQFQSLLGGQDNRIGNVPAEWVDGLVQSGSDAWLNKYQRQLPENVVTSARRFVDIRQNLVGLGR